MNAEFENDLYKIYWHDEEQSILMVEVYKRWTWHDAHQIVKHGNDILAQVNHQKYLICHLIDEATKLPSDNRRAIASLQRLIQLDPGEEEFCIFVSSQKVLKRLILVTGEIYSLFGKTKKYQYADDLSSAFAMINQYKTRHPSSEADYRISDTSS